MRQYCSLVFPLSLLGSHFVFLYVCVCSCHSCIASHSPAHLPSISSSPLQYINRRSSPTRLPDQSTTVVVHVCCLWFDIFQLIFWLFIFFLFCLVINVFTCLYCLLRSPTYLSACLFSSQILLALLQYFRNKSDYFTLYSTFYQHFWSFTPKVVAVLHGVK